MLEPGIESKDPEADLGGKRPTAHHTVVQNFKVYYRSHPVFICLNNH